MNYYLTISHRKYFSLSFIPPSLKERVGVRPVVAYWQAREKFLVGLQNISPSPSASFLPSD